MNGKMKGFVTGILLYVVGKPFPITQEEREPVAYLYGYEYDTLNTKSILNGDLSIVDGIKYVGAALPNIDTVWDKETYPHAYVVGVSRSNYNAYIMFTDKPLIYDADNNILCYSAGTTAHVFVRRKGTDYWEDGYTTYYANEKDYGSDLMWASEDIPGFRPTTAPIPLRSADAVEYVNENVRLPHVNSVWTGDLKEQYPYAFITKDKDGYFPNLYFTTAKGTWNTSYDMAVFDDPETLYWYYWLTKDEWETSDSSNGKVGNNFVIGITPNKPRNEEVIWANYDLNGNSTDIDNIFITVPIPVYESER